MFVAADVVDAGLGEDRALHAARLVEAAVEGDRTVVGNRELDGGRPARVGLLVDVERVDRERVGRVPSFVRSTVIVYPAWP